MGWWLVIFVIGVALGALQLGIGLWIGRWLTPRENLAEERAEVEGERARQYVRRLSMLANRVAEEVGEHRTHMLQANEELTSIHGDESSNVTEVVFGAVAKILQVNERLQDRLATAEGKLREQARQIESQVAAARTDSLTGLPNRRAFDDELGRAIALWHRKHVTACLMILDVDRFKAFNDRHGHLAGDQVLRGVAVVLRNSLRDMDLVARIGGEEFAVILPNTNSPDAKRVADRVRALVAASRFHFEKSELSVTVSVGLAMVDLGDDTVSMIKRADEALYASKRAGRNCGHFHDGETCEQIRVEADAQQPGQPALDDSETPAEWTHRLLAFPPQEDSPASRTDGLAREGDVGVGLGQICEDLRIRLAEVGEDESDR